MAIPRVTISTQSSPLLSLPRWREVCEQARIDGIDLEVANPIRRQLALRGLGRDPLALPKIHSVWIGSDCPSRLANALLSDVSVIVPQSFLQTSRKVKTFDPKPLNDLRARITEPVGVAIALVPINHEGSRAHLDRISAIRHVAEEWDFDLALDLTGAIDPSWEAEAAVLRLGDRLKIVRLTPPTFEHGHFWQEPVHLREVTVSRVLSALADFGFAAALSFRIRPPFWNWSNPQAIADEFSLAVASTLAKFQVKPSSITSPPKRVI